MTEPSREAVVATLREAADALDIALPPAAAERIVAYLDAMLAENRAVNLTAVRDPAQALVLHALDALALARIVTRTPRAVLDLGTGNGFPGIAAAVLWPDAEVVLCDRTRKKLDAIARALSVAALPATPLWLDVAQVRASRPDLVGHFDLVLARAVATPAEVARLARPLLGPSGELVLWLSRDEDPPATLGDDLVRRACDEYRLPEPALRYRRLARFERRASARR